MLLLGKIWDKVFKNGPSKICGRQPVFHKFHLVHSWILCPIYQKVFMPKIRVNFLLQYLGFVINLKKCLIIPNQKTEFLDLIINSVKVQTGINVVDRKSKINNWKVSYNTNRRIIDRREAICLGDCKMNLVLLAIETPHKLSRIAAVKKKPIDFHKRSQYISKSTTRQH